MSAWQFGGLIATRTEIPAWAESRLAEEIGEHRLQRGCLKMQVQLTLKPVSGAAGMVMLRSAGSHGAGTCWGISVCTPCCVVAIPAGAGWEAPSGQPVRDRTAGTQQPGSLNLYITLMGLLSPLLFFLLCLFIQSSLCPFCISYIIFSALGHDHGEQG